MKTVNSLSGGKTSSYIAANYPADYDIFSLVRIEDESCRFKDDKIRQVVEDRLQAPFIGTAEDDTIIYTMLDLEQFIGRPITWVTGPTFDKVMSNKARDNATYLPNVMARFCTVDMKIEPIFNWWNDNFDDIIQCRFGFRANEKNRADNMLKRVEKNGGALSFKTIVGKHKGGRNKWKEVQYLIPEFPLITDNLYKDNIESYWKDKPVRFAYMNNCVGCFHRNAPLLKLMWEKHPSKMQWFSNKEKEAQEAYNQQWISTATYEQIKNWKPQIKLFDDSFGECDSGYCGL